MGAGGRTAPAAAPGAPAWPAALGIAATIAGWSEDSVNAGRGQTECGGVAVGRCPSGRTAEDRPVVRNPAPGRFGGEEAGAPRPPDTGIADLVGSIAVQLGQTGAGQTGAGQTGATGAGGRRMTGGCASSVGREVAGGRRARTAGCGPGGARGGRIALRAAPPRNGHWQTPGRQTYVIRHPLKAYNIVDPLVLELLYAHRWMRIT